MRFTDFQAVFFDMDGTLYHGPAALAGAVPLLEHLEAMGLPVGCLTNNSACTPRQLARRLTAMGMPLPVERIWTAGQAMAHWITSQHDRPRVFNLAGPALPSLLDGQVQWVASDQQPCDIVAVAAYSEHYGGQTMQWADLTIALRLLYQGASMVVGAADRVFPTPVGIEPGSGSWGAMLQFAANLPPGRVHQTGKPQPAFALTLCEKIGVDPRQCLMVGDNLDSDIQLGKAAGMTTALLLTGVSQRKDIGPVCPDLVFDDLPAMLAAMR